MITRRNAVKALVAAGASLPLARHARAAGSASCSGRKFWTMMGDYPHTHALHAGTVKSSCVNLDIAPVAVPATAFARTVAMEFDVSELSLITFLQAKTYGRKLVLLPAVNLSRFQHPFLMYDSQRGVMKPKDLEGARVGVRLFTATTPPGCAAFLPTITASMSPRSNGSPGRSRTCPNGAIRRTSP